MHEKKGRNGMKTKTKTKKSMLICVALLTVEREQKGWKGGLINCVWGFLLILLLSMIDLGSHSRLSF